MQKSNRPSYINWLIFIEVFIAILGLATGFSLLSDPSGQSIGLDVLKDQIPFQSFTLLGLWFIGPYGILPLFLAYGFIKGRLWVWKPAVFLGIVEIIWVIIQIPMVGRSYLQLFIGLIATASLYLLYHPLTQEYLKD